MAIYDPGHEVRSQITLLEASAGTGKTYSIAALVGRLVAELDLPIDAILVVTFTRAAAAELRGRVREKLRTLADAAGISEMQRVRLQRALDRYDEAVITTIHGFCQRVLDRYAFESGAEFDLELLQDTAGLRREIARDFYVSRLHDRGALALSALGSSHVTPSELEEIAEAVEQSGGCVVYPAAAAGAFEEAVFIERVRAFRAQWRAGREDLRRSLTSQLDGGILQKGTYGVSKAGVDRLEQLFGEVDAWVARPTVKATGALSKLSATGLKAYKARQSELQTPTLSQQIDALIPHLQEAQRQIRAEANRLRREFVDFARAELPARKTRARQLAYQDLLTQVQRRVTDPEAGEALRGALRDQFRAALIDEFQDTDPVQWSIFQAVFSGGTVPLYMVGDPKQSIYRFRGADINAYRAVADAADEKPELQVNWRSDAALLDGLCRLFRRTPAGFFGEGVGFVDVRAAERRAHGRLLGSPPSAPIRIRQLQSTQKPLADWCRRAITDQVALDVAGLLQSETTLEGPRGTPRPINASDVAVLVRTNQQAREVREALLTAGVPAVRHSGDSVFATEDASDLLKVLLAVQRPSQKARVKAALTTSIAGLSGSDLMAGLRAEADWDERVTQLRALRDLWETHGFMRAFRETLEIYDTPARLAGLHGGERRLTNLRHLAERIHGACSTERLALHGAVAWLAAAVEANSEGAQETADDELRLESDAPAVQVVTIHGAKGLEYPVTFVPFLWQAPDLGSDRKRNLRGNHAEPPYAPYLDIDLMGAAERGDREADCKAAHTAEANRLAYVALTRARHRVVVYVCAYSAFPKSPLASLLFAAEASPAAVKGDAAIAAALTRLEARCGAAVSIEPFAAPDEVWGAGGGRHSGPVRARSFERRRFDTWWRRTSFSQLKKGAQGTLIPAAFYRGADDELDEGATPESAGRATVPLAEFTPGARFGDVLHDALEHHDFTAGPEALAGQLAHQVARHRFAKADLDQLTLGVQLALDTPLRQGFQLSGLGPGDTLKELAFHIPLAGGETPQGRGWLTSKSLADVFERHRSVGGPITDEVVTLLRQRRFFPVQGYLYGLMDLVFRVGGRYYLADYKSSYLGDRAGDYAPDRLAEHMAHNQYLLQYHLYLVALHRYLAERIADYSYDTHFGGVVYLYVRGMVGHGDTGVFEDRPPVGLVEALSAHFDKPGGGADE